MIISPIGLQKQTFILEILKELHITIQENGLHLYTVFDPTIDGLTVSKQDQTITIIYSQTVFLYRGIGLAVENDKQSTYTISQHARLSTNGVMMDCSRNGVLSVKAAKSLIRKMALMGHNTLMLYTEDTYEIPEGPYWGYMRGRYTHQELVELDAYAAGFGIDLVPCIQTLAHLQSALRWGNYCDIIDIGDILLVGEPKTYQLIERMIAACRNSFRSKRINIGMDEAGMLGRGGYQNLHGHQNSFDIMCQHLDKVIAICEKYGFRPMMWSDMFFHMANGGYNGGSGIPTEELAKVPKNVDLIYWDYYANDQSVYDVNIKKHLQFPNSVLFAGGAWKWSGYTPSLFHSLKVSRLALNACIENGLSEAFVTVWGDNGAEASAFSILPVIQLFAEYSFQPGLTDEELARRFKTCTGANLDNFQKLDLPDFPCETHDWAGANPSKYLLFQDILCGLFDKHSTPDYAAYYTQTATILAHAGKSEPEYAYIFDSLAALCKVLSLKSDIGVRIKDAYDQHDKETLSNIVTTTLPAISAAVKKFKDCIETQWFKENKGFGFEVQDIRIAGVAARAESVARRLQLYIDGSINCIEELEVPRLYFDGRTQEGDRLVTCCNQWNQIASACMF